ncbi:MAG TPA: flagellar basal body L-ring protein FlgH [Spirochaetota bacterium]|nr:flagellar basal body L-ring protein FlgH [Spirochaetota bacterium]HQE58793.1 flagellar basal body L-ring protein FlgH [Spirochaetota bacterium]
MKKYFIISVILFSVLIESKTLWRDRNIYSSAEAVRVGDTVVVSVSDLSRMKFTLNMKSKSNSDITSNPDINLTGFLPKIKSDRSSDNNDTLTVDSKNALNMNIAAVITGAQGRNFAIAGSKEYIINGVFTRFAVTGIVDPALLNGSVIKADNVVNFRLDIMSTKRGIGMNLNRPAPAEGEQAKGDLTEIEKQRIIVDYINRMLEELTRR